MTGELPLVSDFAAVSFALVFWFLFLDREHKLLTWPMLPPFHRW